MRDNFDTRDFENSHQAGLECKEYIYELESELNVAFEIISKLCRYCTDNNCCFDLVTGGRDKYNYSSCGTKDCPYLTGKMKR